MIECNRDKYKVLHLSPNKPQMHEDQTIIRKKKKPLNFHFETKLNVVNIVIFLPKKGYNFAYYVDTWSGSLE